MRGHDEAAQPSQRTPGRRRRSYRGSAGAIEVVSLVLGALAADFATPIVVVIHLPRSRPSALAGALHGKCRLALREPLDKEPLAPATVYLAPPDYHLLIDPGPCFALSVDEPVNFSRPSVDVLFQSAADVLGSCCAGVLVSGANPDGAQGLRAIQEAGGLVAIQDPNEAAQGAMPKAAVALARTRPVVCQRDLPVGAAAIRVAHFSRSRRKMSDLPKLLLVDDRPENLLALDGLLQRSDAQILKAESGKRALELLLEHEVALALIDVQMPELDGFALAELMRNVERTREIPIIFVTAGLHDQDRVFKGYESGAVDFLVKPPTPASWPAR